MRLFDRVFVLCVRSDRESKSPLCSTVERLCGCDSSTIEDPVAHSPEQLPESGSLTFLALIAEVEVDAVPPLRELPNLLNTDCVVAVPSPPRIDQRMPKLAFVIGDVLVERGEVAEEAVDTSALENP